jgi:hypothetical protein
VHYVGVIDNFDTFVFRHNYSKVGKGIG